MEREREYMNRREGQYNVERERARERERERERDKERKSQRHEDNNAEHMLCTILSSDIILINELLVNDVQLRNGCLKLKDIHVCEIISYIFDIL